jgi:pyridinium-3,5-biscarboxylic acid mononucleotide synthase
MDPSHLRDLLALVAAGQTSIDDAVTALSDLPYRDVGVARIDHHRALRQGVPEVVFGERKTPEQIVIIAREILRGGQSLIVTRLDAAKAEVLRSALPDVRYDERSRIASYEASPPTKREGRVVVVTAGTSDAPVAEEAAEMLRLIGIDTIKLYDCGVAGLHRLLDQRETLGAASVIIAIAGMEGALPSVLGGLVACPVIAVPTSVGYGAHLGGLTPLLTMLTTCAAGVVVVNVDNGFGAAMAAHRILLGKMR